ncbi:FG-GAP repeat-containing protein [Nitzschia inconspicua]|uniref:FG-GAP repeat-containing protein n=1 Tax=Nitzschia inconspicua TaxID=303405 RepID=A0A9K3PHH1_9STRA|nr:FG-GAP repeat-containing protein [Nitzschia inconspicua]KAG7347548.1 FG-GAP repeat-containing protein [Nitzschia inconspicua]
MLIPSTHDNPLNLMNFSSSCRSFYYHYHIPGVTSVYSLHCLAPRGPAALNCEVLKECSLTNNFRRVQNANANVGFAYEKRRLRRAKRNFATEKNVIDLTGIRPAHLLLTVNKKLIGTKRNKAKQRNGKQSEMKFNLSSLGVATLFAAYVSGQSKVALPIVTKKVDKLLVDTDGSSMNDVFQVTIKVEGGEGSTTNSTNTIPMYLVFTLPSYVNMYFGDPEELRKSASKSFVDKLQAAPGDHQAGVVSWNYWDGPEFQSQFQFAYGLFEKSHFGELKSHIDAVRQGGPPGYIDKALNEAITMLDSSPPGNGLRAILFMTDSNLFSREYNTTGPTAEAALKGYKIYSIGLGNRGYLDDHTRDNLLDMADQTGGEFFLSPTAENLPAIFDTIFSKIQQSTFPHNVSVSEALPNNIVVDCNSTSPVATACSTTAIVWEDIGSGAMDASESVTLTYNAKITGCGDNLPIQKSSGEVTYDDINGNTQTPMMIPDVSFDTNCSSVDLQSVNGPPLAICKDFQATADDNCAVFVRPNDVDGGSIGTDGDTLTLSVDQTALFGVGTHTVTLTVEDEHGLHTTCTSTVTVVDTTPPTITCPADIVIPASARSRYSMVEYVVTVSDNCDDAPVAMLTSGKESGSTFDHGSTMQTFKSEDLSNNGDVSCSFTITVVEKKIHKLRSRWTNGFI